MDDGYVLDGEGAVMVGVSAEQWNSEKLAEHLTGLGLGDYSEMILNHKITGKLAHLLTDQDIKDMGVNIVGDRLRFRQALAALGRKARMDSRNRTVWVGEERLYFSDIETCLCTCGGLFPDDPSTYRLTSNHLKIKQVDPVRIGPVKLCCCFEYAINNIDLTKVEDVDIIGIPSPVLQRVLCCAPGKDLVEIQTLSDGKVTLVLQTGTGEHVASLIMNQVEEAQVMERD